MVIFFVLMFIILTVFAYPIISRLILEKKERRGKSMKHFEDYMNNELDKQIKLGFGFKDQVEMMESIQKDNNNEI